MRILYATDLHGSKADLELLLELTTADIYLIAGDLIYSTFYSHKNLFAFHELQEEVRRLRNASGRKGVFLKLLQTTTSQTLSLRKYESRLLALGTHVPPHIEKKIGEYLLLEAPPEG